MHTKADETFMEMALEEAEAALARGEVPVGAVVVSGGEVVARAGNRREADNDPCGHAELIAVREAARRLGRWRLSGCTVYVTLEPCVMCAGALVAARIDRCVIGAADPKYGAVDSLYAIGDDPRLNHAYSANFGVLEDRCQALLDEFFSRLRPAAGADE